MIGIGRNLKSQPGSPAYRSGASLEFDFTQNIAPLQGAAVLTCAHNGPGTVGRYFDKNGVLQQGVGGQPRIDHDPAVIGKQNIILQSNSLNVSATWVPTNSSGATPAAAVGPDGRMSMSKVAGSVAAASHYLDYSVTGLGDSSVFSMGVVVKKGDFDTARINFVAKTGVGPSMVFRFSTKTIINTNLADAANAGMKFSFEELPYDCFLLKMEGFSSLTGGTIPRFRLFVSDDDGNYGAAYAAGQGTYFGFAQMNPGAKLLGYIETTTAAASEQYCRGLLIEEQRANYIRNSTMIGAAAGTPGTLPTNWGVDKTAAQTMTVVGTGTEDGLPYIDIRFSVASNDRQYVALFFEPSGGNGITSGVAAGQAWTLSMYAKVVAGSLPGTPQLIIRPFNNTTALADSTSGIGALALASDRLAVTRKIATMASAPAGANRLTGFFMAYGLPVGSAIDFTVRIGVPQLEQGAFATSPIFSGAGVETRNADTVTVASVSPSLDWFNPDEGTLYAEVINGPSPAGSRTYAMLDDGTAGTRVEIRTNTTGVANAASVSMSGATVLNTSFGNIAAYGATKTAAVYKPGDMIAASGGALSAASSLPFSTSASASMTQMRVGWNPSAVYLNGWLRALRYYPRRLSNAELQSITQ